MYKIAISGKGGSGKNTLCKIMTDLISDKYSSYEIKSQSFADPLKKIVSILFPQIPKEHLYGPSELRSEVVEGITLNGNLVTVRDLLIDVGENYKKYDPNIFVNIFDINSKDFCKNNLKSKFLFATDLRFPQEFEYVKKNNFITIRIERKNCLKLNSVTETVQDKISSDQFNFIILNNSTFDDLKYQASNIFLKIISG